MDLSQDRLRDTWLHRRIWTCRKTDYVILGYTEADLFVYEPQHGYSVTVKLTVLNELHKFTCSHARAGTDMQMPPLVKCTCGIVSSAIDVIKHQ
jgi:hypothetical protein